jgi:hypothetical protein
MPDLLMGDVMECVDDDHQWGEWTPWMHAPGSGSVHRTRVCTVCGYPDGVAQALDPAANSEHAEPVDLDDVTVLGRLDGPAQSVADALRELAG